MVYPLKWQVFEIMFDFDYVLGFFASFFYRMQYMQWLGLRLMRKSRYGSERDECVAVA